MAFLCNAYSEEEVEGENAKLEKRTVLRFHKKLAPITAAVFPLVNKDGMPELAHKIYKDLQKAIPVQYDTSGAVGRRYRRQDEAGTPYCITIDGQTLQDDSVTIRDRDSMAQIRINSSQIADYIAKELNS
jgi:glycyl-tRNA synthetase